MEQDVQDIQIKTENNAKREAAALIPVGPRGVSPKDFAQLVDRAKFMAAAKEAIPAHLRSNVGMCIAIHEMALEWGFRPYGVANLCYVVNNRLGFEAQLFVAVINQHAGLTQRLRPSYEGEGDERICIVRGHFRGEVDPCEYRSPKIGTISPKNSPLWKQDSDRQLWYYSARAFARIYCPHILLGIFGSDEIVDNPHIGADQAKDITPGLHEKLSASERPAEGFQHGNGHVERELDAVAVGGTIITTGPTETMTAAIQAASEPLPKRRRGRPKKGTTEAQAPEPIPPSPPSPLPPPPEEIQEPKSAEEYAAYAGKWIDAAKDADNAEARWDGEGDLRDKLEVPIKQRHLLKASLDGRLAALRT